MHSIKDLPLKNKIFYSYIAFLLLPLLLIFLSTTWYTNRPIQSQLQASLNTVSSALKTIVNTTTEESSQSYLQATGDHGLQTVSALHAQYLQGALTLDEAHWLARDILLSQQVAGKGYIFISDSTGRVLFKPEGKEPPPQAATASEKANPASGSEQQRVVHTAYFNPWDWVLNIVCNENELIKSTVLPNLEIILQKVHFDQPHQLFVLDSNGQLFVESRPEVTMPEAKLKEFRDILTRSQTETEGHFTYQWQEFGHYETRDRIAYYNRLTGPGLVVGVSAYTSDLQDILKDVQRILYIVILLSVLGATVAAFIISSSITKPLGDFIKNIAESRGGEKDVTLSLPGFGEVSSLNTSFKEYMSTIRDLNVKLTEEMATSESIHQQLRHEVVDRKDALEKLEHEVATRKSAETYLQLFKNIFDNAIEGIVITDKDARILAVNQSFTDITGYTAQEAMGENPRMLSSGNHDHSFYNNMWQTLQEKGSWSGEIWNKNKAGKICPEWLSISEIKDDRGVLTNYFAFFHDISELKKKEKQISFMAYRDALTKLPNRAALEHRLSKAIAHAKRNKVKLAVFFIDLDNFKKINDSLGHDKGDQLLIQVSQRMSKTIRAEDTLSRLGGDEFILLSENIEHESSVYILANRILESFKQPIQLDARKIYINASLGISIFPNDGDTTPELIKNADMAMYKAKSEGRNKFVLFTQEMNEKLKTNIRIENSIRTGLKNREFVVFYQPKINISTEQATSFEALIRWERNGQIIGPNKFIPVAEESGLIDEMSLYVLEDVCAFLSNLKVRNLQIPISVNISPRTFNNPEIVESIDKILSKHNIAHKLIDFEITETTAMQDVDHTLKVMKKFRERGTSFSIDDFGTGYSSLSYLREMPVSTLKIDKRFIDVGDPNSMSIVSSIVAMSQEMQLKVVAEGAETSGQLRWLKSIGCDEVQGYIFSKPMPEMDTLQYLLNKKEIQVRSVLNDIANTPEV